jgi:large subunit ribosomal protein L6
MAINKVIRRDFMEEIEMPSGIQSNVEENIVTITKDGKEMKRKVDKEITVKKEGNKIILSVKKARKNEKRKFGTAVGHIKNIIAGFNDAYVYELEICNVHFPMTVTFDKAKSQFIIKNLLGEKHPRIVEVSKNIDVEVKAPNIKIKSYDIESAGEAASRLEKCAMVRNRDRNKFQDGIFITKKPGKVYL